MFVQIFQGIRMGRETKSALAAFFDFLLSLRLYDEACGCTVHQYGKEQKQTVCHDHHFDFAQCRP
jgi:hypothetical protein